MARPPSPPDPVIISWSGLKRWENCPQHQLRVILHQTEKQNKGRIFLPGTVCDLAQRRLLESDDPKRGDMAQSVEDIFRETVEKGESKILWKGDPRKDMVNVQNFCRETVTNLEPWLWENVIPFGYAPEVKFTAHFKAPYVCNEEVQAPIKMIGGIDIVVQGDDGKFRLYDLKVTKDPGYIRSTLAQLIFYDLAWGVIQGDFYHATHWGFVTPALPNEPFVPITVTREDRATMLARIIKYAQGTWTDSWDPKPDDQYCNWCEARAVCPKFKTVAYVDENGRQKMSFAQAAAQRKQFRK